MTLSKSTKTSVMTTKIIHYKVGGICDRAEFTSADSDQCVQDLFRTAAEAGPHDIVKLYTSQGHLVNITSRLPANTSDTPYTVAVVGHSYGKLVSDIRIQLTDIEKRLSDLESQVIQSSVPVSVGKIRHNVDTLRHKLETIEQLSWIGLSKDMNGTRLNHFSDIKASSLKRQVPRNLDQNAECDRVFRHFHKMLHSEVAEDVKKLLRGVDFNNWQWSDEEMLVLLKEMFSDLRLDSTFHISTETLTNWLKEVYRSYNRVPFHNFKHCFMVTQMMYGLIHLCEINIKYKSVDVLILLVSAICHDLDHPGYNNAYQVNAHTELAIRYNDSSPLENHHCSVAFQILQKPECNIFSSLSHEQFTTVRAGMIRCILATDMARHMEILDNFESIVPEFEFDDDNHKEVLQMILIKCADISNECRPMEVAEPWIDCLLEEFFNQSDLEKKEGLAVSPFMDREKVNKNSSQVNFIQFILIPLFQAAANVFPQLEEPVVVPLQNALIFYRNQIGATPQINGRLSPHTEI